MSELNDSVDYDNLKSECVRPNKDVRFYEYKNFKELFNVINYNQIKFSEVKNKQNNFLKKLNEVKIGKKLMNNKKWSIILKNFTNSREEVVNFFKGLSNKYGQKVLKNLQQMQ